jgi:hypothetical protein
MFGVAQVSRMPGRFVPLALPLALIFLLSSISVAAANPIESWKSLVATGGQSKARADYLNAARLFAEAVALAEKQKLPVKYKEIALCRQTEAEVLANRIPVSEPHLIELLRLVKAQKRCPVEDDLAIWMVDLAKTYQTYPNSRLRGGCLERACYICELTYGRDRKGFWDAMSLLADYCVDRGQIERAVQVQRTVVAEQEKRFGKNPNALGDTLYQLAIKYKTEHKYDQAKQLALVVIKMAHSNSNSLTDGLPAFYSFLGMNSLAQGKPTEGQEYFKRAKDEYSAIKSLNQKQLVKQCLALRQYFALLLEAIWSDRQETKIALAETEYKQLLTVEQAFFANPLELFGVLTRLAAILELENKYSDCEKCLTRCIALGNLSDNFVTPELADLYMRLGICQSCQHKIDEANASFTNALKAEKDQCSFHSGGVWRSWACYLKENGQGSLALEKVGIALKIARRLPPEKRGNLLTNALQTASDIEAQLGKLKEAEALHQQYLAEIQVQRNLDSRLTPNKYGGYN